MLVPLTNMRQGLKLAVSKRITVNHARHSLSAQHACLVTEKVPQDTGTCRLYPRILHVPGKSTGVPSAVSLVDGVVLATKCTSEMCICKWKCRLRLLYGAPRLYDTLSMEPHRLCTALGMWHCRCAGLLLVRKKGGRRPSLAPILFSHPVHMVVHQHIPPSLSVAACLKIVVYVCVRLVGCRMKHL
jgi:hypothetical protein